MMFSTFLSVNNSNKTIPKQTKFIEIFLTARIAKLTELFVYIHTFPIVFKRIFNILHIDNIFLKFRSKFLHAVFHKKYVEEVRRHT